MFHGLMASAYDVSGESRIYKREKGANTEIGWGMEVWATWQLHLGFEIYDFGYFTIDSTLTLAKGHPITAWVRTLDFIGNYNAASKEQAYTCIGISSDAVFIKVESGAKINFKGY